MTIEEIDKIIAAKNDELKELYRQRHEMCVEQVSSYVGKCFIAKMHDGFEIYGRIVEALGITDLQGHKSLRLKYVGISKCYTDPSFKCINLHDNNFSYEDVDKNLISVDEWDRQFDNAIYDIKDYYYNHNE